MVNDIWKKYTELLKQTNSKNQASSTVSFDKQEYSSVDDTFINKQMGQLITRDCVDKLKTENDSEASICWKNIMEGSGWYNFSMKKHLHKTNKVVVVMINFPQVTRPYWLFKSTVNIV